VVGMVECKLRSDRWGFSESLERCVKSASAVGRKSEVVEGSGYSQAEVRCLRIGAERQSSIPRLDQFQVRVSGDGQLATNSGVLFQRSELAGNKPVPEGMEESVKIVYELCGLILLTAACGVFWKLTELLSAAEKWIKHDLKMRRGGRED